MQISAYNFAQMVLLKCENPRLKIGKSENFEFPDSEHEDIPFS